MDATEQALLRRLVLPVVVRHAVAFGKGIDRAAASLWQPTAVAPPETPAVFVAHLMDHPLVIETGFLLRKKRFGENRASGACSGSQRSFARGLAMRRAPGHDWCSVCGPRSRPSHLAMWVHTFTLCHCSAVRHRMVPTTVRKGLTPCPGNIRVLVCSDVPGPTRCSASSPRRCPGCLTRWTAVRSP